MAEARQYEFPSCPIHGAERMQGDHCLVITERTSTHTRKCWQGETVTAYDARDVEPLVHALELTAALNPAAVGDNDLAHVAIDKARAALPPFARHRSNRDDPERHDEALNSQGSEATK